jgi:hypothetical protein
MEMEPLIIQASEYTPEINLNPQMRLFDFKGVSRPENAIDFYTQIYNWFADYESSLKKMFYAGQDKYDLTCNFYFSYFNSASSKMIYTILEILRGIKKLGFGLIINWYYDNGDDQMREDGEELSEAIELMFNLIEVD